MNPYSYFQPQPDLVRRVLMQNSFLSPAQNKKQTIPRNRASKKQKSGGASHRAGDWVCLLCNNHNYSFRKVCNRCTMQTKKQNLVQSLALLQQKSGAYGGFQMGPQSQQKAFYPQQQAMEHLEGQFQGQIPHFGHAAFENHLKMGANLPATSGQLSPFPQMMDSPSNFNFDNLGLKREAAGLQPCTPSKEPEDIPFFAHWGIETPLKNKRHYLKKKEVSGSTMPSSSHISEFDHLNYFSGNTPNRQKAANHLDVESTPLNSKNSKKDRKSIDRLSEENSLDKEDNFDFGKTQRRLVALLDDEINRSGPPGLQKDADSLNTNLVELNVSKNQQEVLQIEDFDEDLLLLRSISQKLEEDRDQTSPAPSQGRCSPSKNQDAVPTN